KLQQKGVDVQFEYGQDGKQDTHPGFYWIRLVTRESYIDSVSNTIKERDKRTHKIYLMNKRSPTGVAEIPWADFGVDYVMESSAFAKNTVDAAIHLNPGIVDSVFADLDVPASNKRKNNDGAKRVIVSTGFSGELTDAPMVMIGVNQEELIKKPYHPISSNASCTTNCIGPMIQAVHQEFGIVRAVLNTVHSLTASQDALGTFSGKYRDGALANISPASTGAARNTTQIFTDLKGKFDGIALRVPVADVSLSEIAMVVKGNVTAEEINAALEHASETYLNGILGYSEDNLKSTDIINESRSVVIQAR
ncbi:hypothetical protein COV61_03420, partial [Candidatus Micrarchaeota archaeon CG11_big_fil_rev_8_21_14_0_20_47_5]